MRLRSLASGPMVRWIWGRGRTMRQVGFLAHLVCRLPRVFSEKLQRCRALGSDYAA
jgi:hypothetical protein